MTISTGEKIPAGHMLKKMGVNGPEDVNLDDYFKGRKVVLFAVPGAFTPTCSVKHLPGFIGMAGKIREKGVDAIACMAVNDVFVMDAWGKDQSAGDSVDMLADGSGAFTHALGLELDLRAAGLGMRSQRFGMIVEDGTVSHLAIEEGGGFKVSSAEAILAQL